MGLFLCLVSNLVALSLSAPSRAASVSIAWNPNSEGDLAGYRIKYGTTSGHPDKQKDIGNNTSGLISSLDNNTTYYFAVTAYNSAEIGRASCRERV